MSLRQGMPVGAGCRFRESFENVLGVTDQGGVIIASSVDRGISPLGVTARVTYDQTQALLINATQMTIAVRFKTGSSVASGVVTAKTNALLTSTQWNLEFSAGLLICFIGATGANYFLPSAALLTSTEYMAHFVYDGTLAVGSRGAVYLAGLPVAKIIGGTIPVNMGISTLSITVFNRSATATGSPPNDFILRSLRVFDFPMSAEEAQDDYQQDSMQEITPS